MNPSNIKLYVGDAIDEMKKISSGVIDLIIADPPYNLSKNYKKTNDNLKFDEFLEFSKDWLSEAYRILKPGGTIYVFMGMQYISYIHIFMQDELNLKFQNWITWHYTQGVGKKKGFSSRHDDVLVFVKPGGSPTFNLDDIRIPQKYYRRVNNMRGANPGNVWEFSHVHYSQKNRAKHPTQKPEGLIERMVLASSNLGETVLDPFSGSGTTMQVVKNTGRKGIGIDIEPSFIEDTALRLEQEFLGFDSFDKRILRVPEDLNDFHIRQEYLSNHISWFLKNHEKEIPNFLKSFKEKYYTKMTESELEKIEYFTLKYSKEKNHFMKQKSLPL